MCSVGRNEGCVLRATTARYFLLWLFKVMSTSQRLPQATCRVKTLWSLTATRANWDVSGPTQLLKNDRFVFCRTFKMETWTSHNRKSCTRYHLPCDYSDYLFVKARPPHATPSRDNAFPTKYCKNNVKSISPSRLAPPNRSRL